MMTVNIKETVATVLFLAWAANATAEQMCLHPNGDLASENMSTKACEIVRLNLK